MGYYIGIDIGGTSTKLGLVTDQGQVAQRSQLDSAAAGNEVAFVGALNAAIAHLMAQHGPAAGNELLGIGIGAPTGNYATGQIEAPANLGLAAPMAITTLLESHWQVPVCLTNDANLAALGELHYGYGQQYAHLLVVTLGTGIGAGIVSNGQLLHGLNDLAGELGHTTIIPGGRQCSCGQQGCLEAYVSIRGMATTYRMLSDAHRPVTPLDLVQLAERNDPHAIETIRLTGQYLGTGLANAAALLAPECIVLAGGLANIGAPLLAAARQAFNSQVLPNLQGKVLLTTTRHQNNNLALLGAAVLVQSHTQQAYSFD